MTEYIYNTLVFLFYISLFLSALFLSLLSSCQGPKYLSLVFLCHIPIYRQLTISPDEKKNNVIFIFSHFITEYVNTEDEACLCVCMCVYLCMCLSQHFIATPWSYLKRQSITPFKNNGK